MKQSEIVSKKKLGAFSSELNALNDFYKAHESHKNIEAEFTSEYMRVCMVSEFKNEADRRKKEINLALSLLKEAFAAKNIVKYSSLLFTVVMKTMPGKLSN